jgi:aryl-alcohol dehydrogenase (NADP+)
LYGRQEEADRAVVDRVGEVAAARGVPRAQVALAWLLSRPIVTAPIVGATKQQHLDDAVAALDLALDESELARLEEPYVPHARAGF